MPFEPYLMHLNQDPRGTLCAGEVGKDIPFQPARFFLVFGVPAGMVRGQHAHRICEQFLVCIRGRVDVMLDDGKNRYERTLTSPEMGLHIPAGIWGEQTYASPETNLLVFASQHYNPNDYISDYNDFISFRNAGV